MKRLVLFAGYDKMGVVDDYVLYYLAKLATLADIVYVADCEMSKKELAKLAPFTLKAIATRHGEYDFGSYKRGFLWAKESGILGDYDELFLCNDSVYGPFEFDGKSTLEADFADDLKDGLKNDLKDDLKDDLRGKNSVNLNALNDKNSVNLSGKNSAFSNKNSQNILKNSRILSENDKRERERESLRDIVLKMECQDNDFWGLFRHYEMGWVEWDNKRHFVGVHLQSYFVVLKRQCFMCADFAKFMKGVQKERDKKDIIVKYEVGLSALLLGLGFKMGSFLGSHIRQSGGLDVPYDDALLTLQSGFCFLKIGAFKMNFLTNFALSNETKLRQILALLKNYDKKLIINHLNRTVNEGEKCYLLPKFREKKWGIFGLEILTKYKKLGSLRIILKIASKQVLSISLPSKFAVKKCEYNNFDFLERL